jgi:hypothetical protein
VNASNPETGEEPMSEINGKVVIITGASSGLGKAIYQVTDVTDRAQVESLA